MKRIARLAILGATLAALPASAAEVGLLFDKQIGKAQAVGLANTEYEAVKPGGMGVRLGFSVLDLKVAELGIAATYHPKAEEDFNVNWPGVGSTKIGKYSTEYIAIGAQVDWKLLLNVHAGVDIRREKLMTELIGHPKEDTSVTRPWLKAGIGFSIPTPVVSPFVRLEVAMAATKSEDNNNMDEVRKALAPNYQIALYGGIRF